MPHYVVRRLIYAFVSPFPEDQLCRHALYTVKLAVRLYKRETTNFNYLIRYASIIIIYGLSLSVDAYSGTTGYEVAYELYKRVQIYESLNNKKAILLKRLRSGRENKRKSQYANKYSLTASLLQRPLARCFDGGGF